MKQWSKISGKDFILGLIERLTKKNEIEHLRRYCIDDDMDELSPIKDSYAKRTQNSRSVEKF